MFTLPSARWLLCFSPSLGCSRMVMLLSLLSFRISSTRARIAGSLSHFKVCPSNPTSRPHAFAIHGAEFPFPGTAVARVGRRFASAPVRIGLLPSHAKPSGSLALRNPWSIAKCGDPLVLSFLLLTCRDHPLPSSDALSAPRGVRDVSLHVLLHFLARGLVLALLKRGLLPSSAPSCIDSSSSSLGMRTLLIHGCQQWSHRNRSHRRWSRSSAAHPLKTRHNQCVSWSLYPQVKWSCVPTIKSADKPNQTKKMGN